MTENGVDSHCLFLHHGSHVVAIESLILKKKIVIMAEPTKETIVLVSGLYYIDTP